MTAIDGIGQAAPAARSGDRRAAPAGAFRLPDARATAAGPLAGAAEVSLATLLTLQEIEDEPARNRAARRRGEDLLAALAALQRALLGAGVSADRLAALADLVGAVPEAADPALRAAVAAIVLRARIELARHAAV
jgi:hypothetical protein